MRMRARSLARSHAYTNPGWKRIMSSRSRSRWCEPEGRNFAKENICRACPASCINRSAPLEMRLCRTGRRRATGGPGNNVRVARAQTSAIRVPPSSFFYPTQLSGLAEFLPIRVAARYRRAALARHRARRPSLSLNNSAGVVRVSFARFVERPRIVSRCRREGAGAGCEREDASRSLFLFFSRNSRLARKPETRLRDALGFRYCDLSRADKRCRGV